MRCITFFTSSRDFSRVENILVPLSVCFGGCLVSTVFRGQGPSVSYVDLLFVLCFLGVTAAVATSSFI